MPNRIIREGHLDSERVDALSDQAENFYSRLRLVVDDYGRYEYDPLILLGKTFPRRVTRYTPDMIRAWMDELVAGEDPLVIVYQVGKKTFLQVQNFGQRIRKDNGGASIPGKYPDPPAVVCASPPLARELPLTSAVSGEGREVSARASDTTPPPNTTPPCEEEGSGEKPEVDYFAWREAVYARHPKKQFYSESMDELDRWFANDPQQRTVFDCSHRRFCESEDWTKKPHFVPPLATPKGGGWIKDQEWKHPSSRHGPRRADQTNEEVLKRSIKANTATAKLFETFAEGK